MHQKLLTMKQIKLGSIGYDVIKCCEQGSNCKTSVDLDHPTPFILGTPQHPWGITSYKILLTPNKNSILYPINTKFSSPMFYISCLCNLSKGIVHAMNMGVKIVICKPEMVCKRR